MFATRNSTEEPLAESEHPLPDGEARRTVARRRLNEAQMESARRSLEDKIAQLNDAIDDVRQRFEETQL